MKISYKNSGLELLGRLIIWTFGIILVIPIPWVINDSISYFAKGFEVKK